MIDTRWIRIAAGAGSALALVGASALGASAQTRSNDTSFDQTTVTSITSAQDPDASDLNDELAEQMAEQMAEQAQQMAEQQAEASQPAEPAEQENEDAAEHTQAPVTIVPAPTTQTRSDDEHETEHDGGDR